MSRGSGWHGDSRRHSLARKGIRTASRAPKTPIYADEDFSHDYNEANEEYLDKIEILALELQTDNALFYIAEDGMIIVRGDDAIQVFDTEKERCFEIKFFGKSDEVEDFNEMGWKVGKHPDMETREYMPGEYEQRYKKYVDKAAENYFG